MKVSVIVELDKKIGLEATIFEDAVKDLGMEKFADVLAETIHQLASTVLAKTIEHIEQQDLGEIEYEETRSNETR